MQRNIPILGIILFTACQIGDRNLGSIGEDTQGTESGSEGVEAVCGDGMVEGNETCDDANDDDLDACHDDCTSAGQTLWRVEFPNRSLEEIAVAHDRVWVSGVAKLNEDDWLGGVDFAGQPIDDEVFTGQWIGFLSVVAKDRLLWSQAPPPWASKEICVRDLGQAAQCTEAVWDGKPASTNLMDSGFGRVGAMGSWLSSKFIYEIDIDGEIFEATTVIADEYPGDYLLHAFTPNGHVFLNGHEGIAELVWLDDDGMPVQATQVADVQHFGESGEILEVAADGRVAVAVSGSTEGEVENPLVIVVDPDGALRWTASLLGGPLALAFSPDGDLFVLEGRGDGEVALTRFSAEGEARWTHESFEPGYTFHVMEAGPDGTLYLGGPIYPKDEPAVLMAIRP